MKELIKRGGNFVRNNPTIVSSLLLIFVMIGSLFANSYITISRFQKSLDKTLQAKAILAESVMEIAAANDFLDLKNNADQLQKKITEIKNNDSEVSQIIIYSLDSEKNTFAPVASTEKNIQLEEQIGYIEKEMIQKANKFAFSTGSEVSYLSNFNGDRFWNVVKAMRDENGKATGTLLLKLSLAKTDTLTGKTIAQAYWFSIGSMIIVLLLIFNHLRLFAFEIKAKKLEEVDKMKDDFISMASHELKSPLTAVRGYSDLLSDTLAEVTANKDDQIKYLKNINISIDRLKALVEDLLDVSRIEQNRLPINCVSLNVETIVLEIVDEMKSLLKPDLILKNSLKDISSVSADSERMKQILVNLISNAIKYTPKGNVEILSKEDDKFVYLTVSDTGIGLSAENMKNLFSKFYRVKNEKTEKISGTGLGLWISREIARKMGGDIEVESIENVGSHFTLKLKKA